MPSHLQIPAVLRTLVVLALWCVLLTPAASGQAPDPPAVGNWELNVHAAALRPQLFDESSNALQFGGRLIHNFASGFSFGASFDRATADPVTLTPVADLSASLLLYSAGIGYGFHVSPRTIFFLEGGAGAATLSFDQAPPGVAQKSTGLLIPVGGGLKVTGDPSAPSWAFRIDARDNVILLETLAADGGTTNEPRHNLEISAGFSLLFGNGGARESRLAERDSDRDGVPDPRDFCVNRPGARVDARGCPLTPEPAPELGQEPASRPDADQDGVPDSEDACMGTSEGTQVDEAGCPLLPPSPTFEAAPGDEDADGVPDERDACPGTPAGIPVDEQGCLARDQAAAAAAGEPAEEPPSDEGAAARPAVSAACLEPHAWYKKEQPVEFDGRSFKPTGFPQPVDSRFLLRAGTYEGVPIFVSDTAKKPYSDFWMPHCGGEGLFELYIEAGTP